jgi:hypothetical protein
MAPNVGKQGGAMKANAAPLGQTALESRGTRV